MHLSAVVQSCWRVVFAWYLSIVFLSFTSSETLTAQNVQLGGDVARPTQGVGHDYVHGLTETVDPASGNLSIRIDLPTPPGRGFTLPYALTYNSGEVHHLTSLEPGCGGFDGSCWGGKPTSYAEAGFGWSDTLPYVAVSGFQVPLDGGSYYGVVGYCPITMSYNFYGMDGDAHELYLAAIGAADFVTQGAQIGPNGCTQVPNSLTGTYYHASSVGGDDQISAQLEHNCNGDFYQKLYPVDCYGASPAMTVTDLSGLTYSFGAVEYFTGNPYGNSPSANISLVRPHQVEDRNGNIVHFSLANGVPSLPVVDTLGRTLISQTLNSDNTPSSITVGGLSYNLGYTTAAAHFTLGSKNLPTSFAKDATCSFQGDVNISQRTVLGSITFPNNQQYTFVYDPIYGVISDIYYPNGGHVHYDWMVSTDYTTLANFNGRRSPGTPPALGGCSYEYQTLSVQKRTVYPSGGDNPSQIQTFSSPRTVWNDSASMWTTKTTTLQTKDVINSKQAQTVYTYGYVLRRPSVNAEDQMPAQVPVESAVAEYDWDNTTTPIRNTSKVWLDEFEMASKTTTWNGTSTLTTKKIYCWYYGNCSQHSGFPMALQSEEEYDLSAQSTLARKTSYSYYTLSLPCLMLSLNEDTTARCQHWTSPPVSFEPTQILISDGAGNRLAETDAVYDDVTSSGTPATAVPVSKGVANLPTGTHDDVNYGAQSTVQRGNLTRVTRWSNNGASPTTTYSYDSTGQKITMKQPCDNTSCSDVPSSQGWQYSYIDSFDTAGSSGGQPTPGQATNAYLTKVTDSLGHTTSYTYAYKDGQLTLTTDQNNQTTDYYYADPLRRTTETDTADGGKTTVTYDDSTHSETTSILTGGSAGSVVNKVSFDGIGRVIKSETTSDPLQTAVNKAYDGMGNVYTITNPHANSQSPTDGTMTLYYDALGREVETIMPDGDIRQRCYNNTASKPLVTACRPLLGSNTAGWWTDFIDEAGIPHQQILDGMGRITHVVEGETLTPASALQTDYTYDQLGNLTKVLQVGRPGVIPTGFVLPEQSETRSFTYDSLSRLLMATNWETGTVCYGQWSGGTCQGGYDANSNIIYKTDANGSTLSYAYDALNRMTVKSDGNTAYSYVYDQGTNAVGRLYAEYNTSGGAGSAFAYDALGRVTTTAWVNYVAGIWAWQTGMQAQYDLAGNMTQLTYPNGAVLQQAYDGAGRLQSITDATPGGPGTVYFQPTEASQYWPSGALHSAKLGNGVVETTKLNSRLQPCQMVMESPVTTGPGITLDPATNMGVLINRQLFYGSTAETNCGAAAGNSGNIWHITEENGGQQNFGYDGLNRLISASSSNRPAASSYNFNYFYDSFGNMLPTDNSNGNLPFSIDPATNRMMNGSNIVYYPNGNLAFANGHSFAYNTYGYLQQIDGYATGSYVYNGLGERTLSVRNDNGDHSRFSVSTNVYLGGQPMAEYHLDSLSVPWTWTNYVYANGQKIARLVGSGPTAPAVSYYLDDHLGTAQMEVSANGTPTWSGWYTPFGQEITSGWASNYIGNQPADGTSMRYKFTGKERDTESGLDYFGARYYGSSMGRFMSPDWSAKAEPVPYAKLDNPQSLNLYAYVGNNPLNRTDRDGHCSEGGYGCGGFDPQHPIYAGGQQSSQLTCGSSNCRVSVSILSSQPHKSLSDRISGWFSRIFGGGSEDQSGQTWLQVSPFGNTVLQGGLGWGPVSGGASYVPTTGMFYGNAGFGPTYPLTGRSWFLGGGSTTNLDQSGAFDSYTGFFGPGGGLSRTPGTGDTTSLYGFGSPGAAWMAGKAYPLPFSLPPATFNMNATSISGAGQTVDGVTFGDEGGDWLSTPH